MRDESVTLHLSEPDTSRTFATFHRLLRYGVYGACCSHLEFIQHHVPQTLVVDDAQIDVGGKFLARNSRVHWFISVIVVPSRKELLAKVVYGCVLLGESSETVDKY